MRAVEYIAIESYPGEYFFSYVTSINYRLSYSVWQKFNVHHTPSGDRHTKAVTLQRNRHSLHITIHLAVDYTRKGKIKY